MLVVLFAIIILVIILTIIFIPVDAVNFKQVHRSIFVGYLSGTITRKLFDRRKYLAKWFCNRTRSLLCRSFYRRFSCRRARLFLFRSLSSRLSSRASSNWIRGNGNKASWLGSGASRRTSGLTKEILRKFYVKLYISALIVIIGWHSEMELFLNIKVNVIWVLIIDKIEPRCVCLSMSLLDRLLHWQFLLGLLKLREIFESHQVTLSFFFFVDIFLLICSIIWL